MAAIKTDAAATIVILASILAALLSRAAASTSSSSCDDEVSKLTPCYSYIEGSGSSRPTSECCSRLGSTVATKPECLCRILDSDDNLNKTQIMALPKACNVTTPPASACRQSCKNDIQQTPSPPSTSYLCVFFSRFVIYDVIKYASE
ncbi:hypothetical protein C2S52_021148 [Perilla frutescens var. hirtella]|nr:hypothetical protein C2S52_021148 [Perilla frutescens var. hirtella]KAH6808375.1 hypothetical protein C2S51_029483 [Perilla frutescens var. frutescens]